jgi:hypothetical protein
MKIIRPITVDAGVLTSSTATESAAAYSGGTTYAAGAVVASANHTWESLQASNTGHTPGAAGSELWWLDLGSDNKWAMFDGIVQSQTVRANSITVVLTPAGLVDTIALLNVSAASIQIVQTDAVEGVVYDQTYGLVSDSGITDWYAYFFEPIVREADLVVSDLRPYIGSPITVTITDTGLDAAVGALIIGAQLDLGGTQWSVQVGIDDYSVKKTDDFGNVTIVERAFNRRMRCQVWVQRGRVNVIQNILAAYRATPLLFIGSVDDPATTVYGFYSSFNQVISYPEVAVLDLDIKGLV